MTSELDSVLGMDKVKDGAGLMVCLMAVDKKGRCVILDGQGEDTTSEEEEEEEDEDEDEEEEEDEEDEEDEDFRQRLKVS